MKLLDTLLDGFRFIFLCQTEGVLGLCANLKDGRVAGTTWNNGNPFHLTASQLKACKDNPRVTLF